MQKITFKKVKFKYHAKDINGRRTQGIIITATRWVMLLDGKRISNTYTSNNIGTSYQCMYKGEPLSKTILFPMGDDKPITVVNSYKTLLEAKKALVDYLNKDFNQHFDANK